MIHFWSKDLPMIHELVTKNVNIKKQRPFFVSMEEVLLPQSGVLLREGKNVSLQSSQ